MTAQNSSPNGTVAALASARDECFAQATNGDLSEQQRQDFAQRAEQLSDVIDKLAAKNFQETTKNLGDGSELQSVVTALQDEVKKLDQIEKNFETAQKAIVLVDSIISLGMKLAAL